MAFDRQIMLVKGAASAGPVPAAQEPRADPELRKPRRVRQGVSTFDREITGMWCSQTSNSGSYQDQNHILSTRISSGQISNTPTSSTNLGNSKSRRPEIGDLRYSIANSEKHRFTNSKNRRNQVCREIEGKGNRSQSLYEDAQAL